MKKSKGFTLIEIMAVVVILAVMALIVVPLITGSIKDSKQKLYETQLENIKSGAKSYMINLDLPNTQPITITLEDLQKKGLVDKDIKNPITGEEFNKCMLVQVTKTSETVDIYEYEIIDDVADCSDNGDLIMALIGSINEEVIYGKTYVEPGIILETTKGEKLDLSEVKVEIEKIKNGETIENIEGNYNDLSTIIKTDDYYEYTITYIYDGEKGNGRVKRNVKVKDASNLQCIILTGKKNENGWITDNREVRILSINTDAEVEYSLSVGNNSENYGTNNIIEITNDGELINVYGSIRDKKGNKASCSALNLKYETDNPSCRIDLDGTKGTNNWYIGDVNANMIPTVISPISEKGMSLSNILVYNGEQNLTLTNSGNVYGFIKDEAGKSSTCSNSVKIDKTTSLLVSISGVIEGTSTSYTPGSTAASNVVLQASVNPVTTASGYKYQWYKDNVAISGATRTSYIAKSDGNYKLVVTTGSGVTGVSNTINVKIDTARPTCSLKVNSGTSGLNGWYTSDVVVGMNKTDATYYGTNSSYNMLENQTLSASGTAYCYVANSTKTVTNSNSMKINIDKTEPTVSLTATAGSTSNYNTTEITLTATAIDPESGIARYEFYDGTTLLGNNTTGTYVVSSLSSSASSYKVRVYNNAGLYSESSITESCSINSSLSSSTCVNGYKTTVYTCTGTGRQWSTTESCSSSCGTISCPSGMSQCGCSCCGTPSGGPQTTTRVIHDGGNCKVTFICPAGCGTGDCGCITKCI